jgi:pimeloyl-ACP methyl ester carboxylesterase
VCISRAANDQIRDKLSLAFADMGEQTVKNIARAIGVFGLAPNDIAALPEAEPPRAAVEPAVEPPRVAPRHEQKIHFCMTPDSIQLAYSQIGSGPPLVKTGNWMTHLEFDFDSPFLGQFYREVSQERTVVRYDVRGNGLSDREVEDVSFEGYLCDLETVVDAAKLDRFALLAFSQGCALAIAYAVRHPERVTHMILIGGYPVGGARRARTPAEKEQWEATLTLVRVGWGQENPAFRQLFTTQFVPDATKEHADWFNELQRMSISPEEAVRAMRATGDVDVSALLPQVTVPTLVMHARDDARVPFDQGRRLAAGIPGARFVPLASRNHILLQTEPAFARFTQELKAFLAT